MKTREGTDHVIGERATGMPPYRQPKATSLISQRKHWIDPTGRIHSLDWAQHTFEYGGGPGGQQGRQRGCDGESAPLRLLCGVKSRTHDRKSGRVRGAKLSFGAYVIFPSSVSTADWVDRGGGAGR